MEIDKELFRDMVRFYGEAYHLPPLSAKIFAYLVFDFERKGISFEEFVSIFNASKSSVSSNLNLLLNLKIITDFNKIDERKRFFVLNENYMKIRFAEIISRMQKELSIVERLSEFRQTADPKSAEKVEIYRNLFQKNIQIMTEALDQL